MITRAKIIGVVPNSNGYKWRINIPILYGKPDNAEEKKKYDDYYKSTSSVSTNSSTVKKSLLSQYFATLNKTNAVLSSTVKEKTWTLDYETEAYVCGIPNSRINYNKGDIVIVGFENNNMGTPIILGSLLTNEICSQGINTKIELAAQTLTVELNTSLPLELTQFNRTKLENKSDIDETLLKPILKVSELDEMWLFYKLLSTGITVDGLIKLFTVLNPLLDKIEGLFGSTSTTDKDTTQDGSNKDDNSSDTDNPGDVVTEPEDSVDSNTSGDSTITPSEEETETQ